MKCPKCQFENPAEAIFCMKCAQKLNGISAEGYLEKARTMFQETDLQWDLDELDKITASV